MNIEPFWLPRLRRKQSNRKNTTPDNIANRATEPMTMPAIAPPDSRFFEPPATEDGDGVTVVVAVGILVEKVINAVMVGSLIPAHRVCASEL